jgi:hypothetical protein
MKIRHEVKNEKKASVAREKTQHQPIKKDITELEIPRTPNKKK